MMGVAEKDEDAFNRTLVELKLPTRLTRSTPGLSFNRTLVELKPRSFYPRSSNPRLLIVP